MVAGWGAVLLMGVTDPLGGINTLFPLFGIANQLLAAIALAVCLTIVAKPGPRQAALDRRRAAGFRRRGDDHRIDAEDLLAGPGGRLLRQHSAFQAALAQGETSSAPRPAVPAMEAVVRNTIVQGMLSVIFVTLASS